MPASVSVNTALPQPKPMVPMDTESDTRFETIAGATRWKPKRGIFNLLRCPVMPTQVVVRIQTAGTNDGRGHYIVTGRRQNGMPGCRTRSETSAKWKHFRQPVREPREGFRTVRVSREKPRLPVTGNIRFPLWCLDKFQTTG